MEISKHEVREKLNKYKIVNAKLVKGQSMHTDVASTPCDYVANADVDGYLSDAVNVEVDGYLSSSDDGGPIEILDRAVFTVRVQRRQ